MLMFLCLRRDFSPDSDLQLLLLYIIYNCSIAVRTYSFLAVNCERNGSDCSLRFRSTAAVFYSSYILHIYVLLLYPTLWRYDSFDSDPIRSLCMILLLFIGYLVHILLISCCWCFPRTFSGPAATGPDTAISCTYVI